MAPLRSALPSLQPVRDGLTDDSLRFAILAGLATIPFTLLLSWEPVPDDGVVVGGSVSGLPLLVAAVVVGYRYSDRETESRRAGVWTGLVGSIGTVLLYLANSATTMWTGSQEMTVFAAVFTPPALILGVGLTTAITAVIAAITARAVNRLDREHRIVPPGETRARDVRDSRWWIPLAAYVLLAPPAAVVLIVSEGQSDGWFLLSALFLLVLIPLSFVAFVALFIDGTEPRPDGVTWIPSMWVYVGLPITGYALVYLVAAYQGIPTPSAPGIYGFIVALWVTAVGYLIARYRHVGGRIR
ncbi:DUF5518 domain-containing protein [Halostagnicola kamekurae]|uniref:Uncharacterized protein n=1 Tax=Halostagnicola kamekurae TaxID=619731 RepID=A0A1I6PLB4_9EURY|nr:DUF5518 domain-containing protein [Halostagnicola kamekurae]SFS40982.1 hypothetical protein SAMN04488556_0641 [Halostagnicola kamekurae]